MLKPVYFAFVKTMLEFFANYTFCYITSTFAKTNKQNNCDDSFETRYFDEGRPSGEPPCKSLVQRSRMLMQKRPLLTRTRTPAKFFCGFDSDDTNFKKVCVHSAQF